MATGERKLETVYSINKVPIRLTYKRLYHITENHDDLASYFYDVLETIEKPEFVLRGNSGSFKATKNVGNKKWMVVIYKELSRRDGFVITAYFLETKPKGEVLWPR
jgi:hypothetical protein